MISRRTLWFAAVVVPVILTATIAFAQQIWIGNSYGRGRTPPRWATAADFDGSWVFCRGFYSSVRRFRSGSGWNTDYPGADNNFSVRLGELTRIPIKFDPDGQPNHVVVRLDDPMIYRCGMLFMTDIGSAEFSDEEVATLRDYFQRGGFVWVDDTWGSEAWSFWVEQIERVLPPGEFPIVDIPPSHPLMHMVYDVKAVPAGPVDQPLAADRRRDIGIWRRQRGRFRQGDQRFPRERDGVDDAQHRYLRHMGARRRGAPHLLRHVLTDWLCDWGQRRSVCDDALTPPRLSSDRTSVQNIL